MQDRITVAAPTGRATLAALEQHSKKTINENVKSAVFQTRESLRHAVQRDLMNTTLPRDAYENIIQITEKTWFHKQHQFWSNAFSNLHMLQPYNVPSERFTNLLERDLHEQGFLLGQLFDKEAVYFTPSDQGLAGDILSQHLSQKQEKVVEKHIELLMRWSHGWKSKQPYQSYLVSLFNTGYNPSPAMPGTSPMVVQSNGPHAEDNAYGVGYGYIAQNLPVASQQNPVHGYCLVNGSPVNSGHSVMQATSAGNLGNPKLNFQLQTLPRATHIAARGPPTTDSISDVATPADSTSNRPENITPSKTTKAKKEKGAHVELEGRYDIFKDLPSSTKEYLVTDATPLESVLEEYPNHVTLHRVALRFKNAGWSIADMAKKLQQHQLKAAFIATKLGEGQLDEEAKLAAIHNWVKNQRGKATQHVLNTQRSAKRRRGEDLEIKPRKRKATTSDSTSPREEEEDVSTPQTPHSTQSVPPADPPAGSSSEIHSGRCTMTTTQALAHNYLPIETADAAGAQSGETLIANNDSMPKNGTEIPQNNELSNDNNQSIAENTNFELTADEITAMMNLQTVPETPVPQNNVSDGSDLLMRPEDISALQDFISTFNSTENTTSNNDILGQQFATAAEPTTNDLHTTESGAEQESAQTLIEKSNQCWEEIWNNFMKD